MVSSDTPLSTSTTLRAFFDVSRPKHWIKSVLFVSMPLPFALAAGAEIEVSALLLGLGGFFLASSGIYTFNDIQDADRDRAHPEKRFRPIASGRLSVRMASIWCAALLVLSFALTASAGHPGALVVVGTYLALNFGYCLGLKHVPLVDVFLLASYYVLRVTLGCVLVGVFPSNWLLLCTTSLALFLALAKRRADIVMGLDAEHRPVLDGYDRGFLDQAMGICAGMTLISYSLYCLEGEFLVPGREFASLPFVVFGVLETLRLAHLKGEGGSPVDLLLRSPALLATGVGWLLAIAWSVQRSAV